MLSLDIGLPTERLAGPLRSVLGGASDREESVVEAVNRRGRAIECTTTILPLLSAGGDGDSVRGAIILMQDGPPSAEDGRPSDQDGDRA